MDWLDIGYVDTVDAIIIALITIAGVYFYFKYQSDLNRQKSTDTTPANDTLKTATTAQRVDTTFLGRMKSEDRQILILYGSQTGTAEELAGRLAKDLARYGQKPLLMDPEDIDVEDLPKVTEINNALLLLCVATYGEGDPTDNAQSLFEFLSNNECELNRLHYAVFGLGNKTYEHYNEVGKFFDRRLEELGAKRAFELGLGNDDANLEEDFMRWREAFLPALAQKFGWELSGNGLQRQYRLEIVEQPTANVFRGEFDRIGAFERQRPPFDQKNPFVARVVENRDLHTSLSKRICRHIELAVDPQRVRYEAGDHIGIFPTNNGAYVEEIGTLLDVDLDTVFKLIDVDPQSTKRYPFPCPCSYRTALTHYVDISAPVKTHVLKALSELTTEETQRERLMLLSTTSEAGLKEYDDYIQKSRRNVIDILREFDSCRPPLDLLLELLPRLQARYYSISSSPKTNAKQISVTALVLRYEITQRQIQGVCTNYLASKNVGEECPVFVHKSTMRLPHRVNVPVIMIGPGTGLAPFRGFLHERLYHRNQDNEVGEMLLFFGCRHSEHDYIYREELEEFQRSGLLTELHLAFSREDPATKVYVQNRIWERRERLWDLIHKSGAYVYVCGDARNMARDVQSTFLKIFQEVGQLDEATAHKLLKDLGRQRRYQADVWS